MRIIFSRMIFLVLCSIFFLSALTREYCQIIHYITFVSSPIRNRVNPYQYVHNTFRRNNLNTIDKWVSKEPRFKPITYEMKDNVIWNGRSVCHNDTYVLLLYFVNRRDTERRQVIRKYVKQSMLVDGKVINYAFVVASPIYDSKVIDELKQENSLYGDILISLHENNYRLFPISILDAFYWVREYCKTVSFVARIDGDVWVHLGNLVHYLKSIPHERILAGLKCHIFDRITIVYKDVANIPWDYPRPIYFVGGGAYVVSRDVVPYINIGAQYLNVILPVSEDIIITDILHKAGIGIYPSSQKYTFLQEDLNRVEQNVIFYHKIKDIALFKDIYSKYSSVYLTPYTMLLK